jgi:hypothetical protein
MQTQKTLTRQVVYKGDRESHDAGFKKLFYPGIASVNLNKRERLFNHCIRSHESEYLTAAGSA